MNEEENCEEVDSEDESELSTEDEFSESEGEDGCGNETDDKKE